MHGYAPHEAFRLLNPLYWVGYWTRCARWELKKVHRHYFGHHRVVFKDENESGDTIAVVRKLMSEEYVVECEIRFIMQITYKTTSHHQARRVFSMLRDEVWHLAALYRTNAHSADALDGFLEALEEVAQRYQR